MDRALDTSAARDRLRRNRVWNRFWEARLGPYDVRAASGAFSTRRDPRASLSDHETDSQIMNPPTDAPPRERFNRDQRQLRDAALRAAARAAGGDAAAAGRAA
jgi:hypothetical protein